MTDAFILDAVRTPRGRGRPDGSLHPITPVQLAAQTLAALRDRNNLDTKLVDDVTLGCVTPVMEQGADIARVAALVAGYDESVPGKQLNRFCASGLESVNTAAAQVMSGSSDMAIGGGVESMSRVPMGSDGGAWAIDPRVAWQQYFVPQGISADLIATLDGYTRETVDAYAVESQRRAAYAQQAGHFDRSIIAVKDAIGEVALAKDEYLRPGTTMDDLAKLKPAFTQMGEDAGFDAVAIMRYPQVETINHVHTAGNSSGIVDGAAAMLVGSKKAARKTGIKPRARIVGFASIGSEPTIMLTGPAAASRRVLKRCGMKTSDIDLWEINEAFAAVVLRFMRDLDLSPGQVNVNGGAIAMGHPLGATGAIRVATLLHGLRRHRKKYGMVTMCIGTGMGAAGVFEAL